MISHIWGVMFGLVISCSLYAEDGITVRFRGEDGKPLPNAVVHLYELNRGMYVRAICRNKALDVDSSLRVTGLPAEYMLVIDSRNAFYHKRWHSSQMQLAAGDNVVAVTQTGIATLAFKDVDANFLNGPYILAYYRKTVRGEYTFSGSVGLALKPGSEIEIPGLEPGDYAFEIKRSLTRLRFGES